MAKFKDRIKQLREEHGLTLDEFAKIFNTHRPTIWRYEKGERQPTINFVKMVADYFDVSLDWLAGNSDIREKGINASELTRIFNSLSDGGKKEIFRYAQYIQKTDSETKDQHIVNILGQTAAGSPLEYCDWFPEPIEHPPANADFALKVKGDSMEPTIKNGSIIWVHKQPDIENGEIAIVEIDGTVTCKKVYKKNGYIELHSINKAYKPIVIDKGDVKIIGKVILKGE